ncbi:hypothetical protein LOK49_Contig136G00016 [Camellia lanceoleosa]|nr:hypothetical protein LOK49_Contig136G00016 [Camellia lanceoleosa]
MGVTTYTQEFTTSVAPNRMFKALILDSHNLIPKLLPQSIKSIEYVEGDGSAGSIKQTNFHEGSHMKCLKHKIDLLDVENYECKYTLIEGDGGAGSIKQTNFPEGSSMKCMKHKIDLLDVENYKCKYTLIEGDALDNKLESLSYEVKFEPTGNGCETKVTSISYYHAKGDIELKEEEMAAGKDKGMGMFKIVEEYLIANPDVYA